MSNDKKPGTEDLPYEVFTDLIAADEHGRSMRRTLDLMAGRGNTDQAITNTFMGFNHRIAPTHVPINRERSGYTFFTRPDLTLNEQNVAASRRFTQMAESPISSAERAILGMLDPFCPYTMAVQGAKSLGMDFHPDVPFDNKQAFLPILSNRLISLTGFPDNNLDVYTSEEGIKREQWSMVDSHYGVNYSYSLNAVFKNLDGDVTTQLISAWLEAMSGFYDGTFIPRARNMIQNEINYQTRIYRLIMDPTLTYVTKIGAAMASIPVNDNLGATFNQDASNPVIETNDTINIQFHCNGAQYLDPRLIEEFNEVVSMFNPGMLEDKSVPPGGEFVPAGNLVRIPNSKINYFNYYGYPHIDRNTKELSWYVDIDDYDRILGEATI